MKKSFKKVVAILLAVMMIVCSFPLTVLAAGDANRANINLQFGDVSCSTTKKTYSKARRQEVSDFLLHSGLNSDKLTYSNGKIDGYNTGDFFTVSVLLENVTELSAAEVAVKYSEAIEPAYIRTMASTVAGTATTVWNVPNAPEAYAGVPKNEAIPSQSGNALYNSTSTLGETSYVDPEARIMHANFAVQTGSDSVSLTDSKAVLATFMFKIVNDQPITFSIDNTQSDPYETYTLGTIANGGKVEEYKTYAKVSETDVPTLDFMGENEYNGTVGKNYTITFVDADGQQISADTYKEGTAIVPPSLPATTHDDAQHYTYAWDKEIPATATADGTYTIIKTGAPHTWDAGVVTTEPTTESTGVKTYTCTFDGCGAKKTETLPKKEDAHVHTWSEWKYNNDAVYNVKAGTATRTCTDPNCPEHATETKTIEETKALGVYGKTVTLGAAVTLNLMVLKSTYNSFDNVYAEITFDNTSYIIDSPVDYASAYKRFDFDKIGPKNFGKPLVIKICGTTKDGIKCESEPLNYSIKTYLYNMLKKNPTPNLKKLLVETLYYGEADQKYNNINTDLLTAELTEEQKAVHTKDVPSYVTKNQQINNPTPTAKDIVWRGSSLSLSGAVYVMYYVVIPSTSKIDDYKFTFTLDGVNTDVTYANDPDCFKKVSNTEYYLFFKKMGSHQYSLPVTAVPYDIATGQQVGPTKIYSAESYALSKAYVNGTAQLRTLVDQLLRYGRANIAYRANPKG